MCVFNINADLWPYLGVSLYIHTTWSVFIQLSTICVMISSAQSTLNRLFENEM